jgi:diguanylate cyclase (GGDEF)-like protein
MPPRSKPADQAPGAAAPPHQPHGAAGLYPGAHFDPLTGLPNRILVTQQIGQLIARGGGRQRQVALFLLDLDNFKLVNDTMGHEAGDALLVEAADRVRRTAREAELAAHLGGDEFLLVSGQLDRPGDAEVLAHRIVSAFRRPLVLDGREFHVSLSVGVAVHPQDGDDAARLIQRASTAMYRAKALGRDGYAFFTGEMQQAAERRMRIGNELRRAVHRGELTLLFQPKVALTSGRIVGAEALLRWQSPQLGAVSPEEFVPVAELAGLMPQIGDWVLREACREVAAWRALGAPETHVAINVSPQQFHSTDLLANVAQALAESALPADAIELEITESLLVRDAPQTHRVLDDLRELGVRLALDDFGTGYSSLAYLKRFPMQVLKIDRSFISDIGSGQGGSGLVDAIVAMARSLGMQVVAEGVENETQLAYLAAKGVEMVQGFHFSPAVDATAFRAMLTAPRAPAEARAER